MPCYNFSQNFNLPKNFVTAKQGFALNLDKSESLFLNLELEYYSNEKFSLISGSHILLSNATKTNIQYFNGETFLGGNYHWMINSLDVYIGAQPGYQIVSNISDKSDFRISPLVSIAGGINYYSSKYFHFFAQIRYLYINQLGKETNPTKDWRIAFGLGYNFTQICNAIFKRKESP